MSIFSNIKINSLRKKVEDKYVSRIEKMALDLKMLPEDQKRALATKAAFSLQATEFAKIMNFLLFRPDVGVFRDDIGNLDEFRFNQLYQKMVVWYSWIRILPNPEGGRDHEGMNFCIDSLETCLGINSTFTMDLYGGLNNLSDNLVPLAFYRWCMLDVGHIDSYYDTMHENSPNCVEFIATAHTALLGVDGSLKNHEK